MTKYLWNFFLGIIYLALIWWRFPWDQAALLTTLCISVGNLGSESMKSRDFHREVLANLENRFRANRSNEPKNPLPPSIPGKRIH